MRRQRHPGAAALLILLLVPALPAGAQTIWHCAGPQGTVYSQLPCGDADAPGERVELPPAPLPRPEAVLRADAAARAFDARVQARHEAAAQSACIDAFAGATRRGTHRRITALEARIGQLQADMRRATPTLAGITWSNGLRTDIAALEAGIRDERRVLMQTELAAMRHCAAAPH